MHYRSNQSVGTTLTFQNLLKFNQFNSENKKKLKMKKSYSLKLIQLYPLKLVRKYELEVLPADFPSNIPCR